MSKKRFTTFAWGLLVYTIVVILWGAFVRATGSGAGCGSHWPTCNGQVLPRPQQIETIIEFAHRLSSGLFGLLVLALVWMAFRLYPKGHIVRTGATLALVFTITESLLGAGLVLFEWVAYNVSVGRVVASAIHLLNTSVLVIVIALTGWWAAGGKRLRWQNQGTVRWWLAAAFVGYMVLGASGAVTALGDTIFPAETLAQGLRADLDPTSHFLVRLRVWHPVIAIGLGIYLMLMGTAVSGLRPSPESQKHARYLKIFFGVQLLAGFANVLLLAPVWMQMVHLLLANVVLIVLVLFSANVLSQTQATVESRPVPAPIGD